MAGPYSQIRKHYKLNHGEAEVCGLGLLETKLVSSGDNDVKLWDLKTGECLKILKGHKAKVSTTGFQGPGLIYSGGSDRTIKIWSSTSGVCLRTFVGHTRSVTSAVSQGEHLFSASHETILQWDTETGTLLRTITGHKGAVNTIAISGKKIVSGGNDRTVRIWDLNSSKVSCLTDVLQRHTAGVNTVIWTGKTVVSGSADLTLCFWNTDMSTCSQQLEASGSVRALGAIQDYLFAGIHIASVKLYNWEKCRYIKCFSSRKTSWIESLVCNSNYLVTGDRKGLIRAYTFEASSRLSIFPARFPSSAPTSPRTAEPLSPKTASSTKSDPTKPRSLTHSTTSPDFSTSVRRPLVRSQTPSPGSSKRRQESPVVRSPEGKSKKVLFPTSTSTGKSENLSIPRSLSPPPSFPHSSPGISPTKIGRRSSIGDSSTSSEGIDFALDVEEDGKLSDSKRKLDLSTGRYVEQKSVLDHGNAVYAITMYDQTLFSSGTDGIIAIWDLETNVKTAELRGHTNAILSLSYDKKLLVSGARDHCIKIWDVSKNFFLQDLTGHTNDVGTVLYRNSQLFSASYDQTILQWDLEKGKATSKFVGHSDVVKSIDINGNQIVSASLDRTLRMWDIRSQGCVRMFKGHAGAVNAVSFYNEGDGLASGSSDMSVRLWDLKLDTHVPITVSGDVRSIALQGKRLIVGTYNTVKIFEILNGRCLKTLSEQTSLLETLICHYNTMAYGNRKGQIKLFNLELDDDHKFMNKLKQKIGGIRLQERYSELDSDYPEDLSSSVELSAFPISSGELTTPTTTKTSLLKTERSLSQSRKQEEISSIPELDEETEAPSNGLVLIR